MSCPKRTILSCTMSDKAFAHPSFTAICNFFQTVLCCSNAKTYAVDHLVLFFGKKTFHHFLHPVLCAAFVLCTTLIWNHFNFISRSFCSFLKLVLQLIQLLYVVSSFLAAFWFIYILYQYIIVKACTLLSTISNLKGLYQMIWLININR